MTCLSCWVCSSAAAVLKLVRVKGRSVSSKNAGAELCVRGETCEVSDTKLQPGAGTWHSDRSLEQLKLSLDVRQCHPPPNINLSTMSPSPWQCCVLLYRPEDMNHVSWLLLICLIECVTEGGGTLGSGDGESPSKCLPLDKTQSWEFYDCLWLLTIRSVAPHINYTENMAAQARELLKCFTQFLHFPSQIQITPFRCA